ncbi:hypothetical protein BDV28DRAFT_139575 [Aspergillus coremiiformis]|uniref:Uncharacterized protein n=1 Tax=Aspergillus coremiiformis TaxID=138285 RepID=A0A5N6Z0H5_9EURO|nr:hypothetical protein BDV28DRAFT_139575 [Aspergillus coremiiformis]
MEYVVHTYIPTYLLTYLLTILTWKLGDPDGFSLFYPISFVPARVKGLSVPADG